MQIHNLTQDLEWSIIQSGKGWGTHMWGVAPYLALAEGSNLKSCSSNAPTETKAHMISNSPGCPRSKLTEGSLGVNQAATRSESAHSEITCSHQLP